MPRIPLRQAALLSLALLVASGGSERTGGAPLSVVYGGVFMGNDGTEGGNLSLTLRPEDGTGSGTLVVNGAVKSLTRSASIRSITTPSPRRVLATPSVAQPLTR
ncbi:MAG: hypothetical protein SGJ01_11280 [Gemmatimonadota bacterium]|nr:hypothetical protein [Gemmatimonadota bacterium]